MALPASSPSAARPPVPLRRKTLAGPAPPPSATPYTSLLPADRFLGFLPGSAQVGRRAAPLPHRNSHHRRLTPTRPTRLTQPQRLPLQDSRRIRSRRPAASRRPNALHSRMDGRGPRRDGTPRRPAASGRPAASPGGGGGRRSPSLPPHVEEQLAARRPSGPGPTGNPPVVSPRHAAAPSPRQLGRGAAPPPAELPPHLRHLSAGPEGRGRQGQPGPADQDTGGTERGGFHLFPRPSRSPHSPPAPDHGRRVVMIRWVAGWSAGRVDGWGSGKAGRCLGGWWAAPAIAVGCLSGGRVLHVG